MYALSKFYLENLIGILVLVGFVSMISSFNMSYTTFWFIASLISLFTIRTFRFCFVDVLFLVYITHCLLTFVWGDVPLKIFYYGGIKSQVFPASFYLLGRSPMFKDCDLMDRAKWPLVFAFVSGLYFHFYMPAWYMNFKMSSLEDVVSNSVSDWTRLGGFWAWSYFLGYISLFYLMYEIKLRVIDGVYRKWFWPTTFSSLLVLFFAQQRVSIAYFIIFILLLYIVTTKSLPRLIIKMALLSFGVLIVLFVVYKITEIYLGDEFLTYFLNRSVDNDSNLVLDRISMFEKFVNTITFFGQGIGMYSHFAIAIGKEGISDCDYLRIPNEIGLVGAFYLLIIILAVLIMGAKRIKRNFYETNVVSFLLAAMIGAAPLEAFSLHPYMYWFCMGRIVCNNFNKVE